MNIPIPGGNASLLLIVPIVLGLSCKDTAAPAEIVTQYTLRPDFDCIDLETGGISTSTPDCPLGAGPRGANDVQLVCCAPGWPGVFHNRVDGRIAHLMGSRFASVRLADTAGAAWSTQLLSEPFDTTRTLLIHTGAGNIYKLGNPVLFGQSGADSTRFDTARLN